jgi:hypothetical protein
MYKVKTGILLLSILYSSLAMSSEARKNVKIKITAGNKVAIAMLDDNPTSNDFAKRLPLTIELTDYSSTEKIHYLSSKLSVKDAPPGMTPSRGDITYYSPWGNLAVFYKGFSYSSGLIKLGKIESGLDILNGDRPITAKFEVIE